MKFQSKIMTIAGVAVVLLFAGYAMVTTPRVGSQVPAPVAKTPEKPDTAKKEYRAAVLRRLEMGDRVTVPDDRIVLLEGDVKLVNKADRANVMAESTKSMKTLTADLPPDIETLADRLTDPALRAGLKQYARNATAEQRTNFLYVGGKVYVDDAGGKAVPAPTEDAEKKCNESCQTITNILCKEVCNWDCRIVNGEKVCEKSCSTICPEITNIVCKKVCD